MTSILPAEVDTGPVIVEDSMGVRRLASARRVSETGVDGFWQALNLWITNAKAPYKRTRRIGMHVRLPGDN